MTSSHEFREQNDSIGTGSRFFIAAGVNRVVRIAEAGQNDVQLFLGERVIGAELAVAVAGEQSTLGQSHNGVICPEGLGYVGVVIAVTGGRSAGYECLFDSAPLLTGSAAGSTRIAGLAGRSAPGIAAGTGGTGALTDGDGLAIGGVEVTEQFIAEFGHAGTLIILVDIHYQTSGDGDTDAVGAAAGEGVGGTGHFQKNRSAGRPIELVVLYVANPADNVINALVKISPLAALAVERTGVSGKC